MQTLPLENERESECLIMPIPESQLSNWTKLKTAAIDSAQKTHQRIRSELEDTESRLNNRGDMRFDTRLQGSYRNDTIVRGSGDVDILVFMTNPFSGSTNALPRRKKRQYHSDVPMWNEDYGLHDFQRDVYDELVSIYGSEPISRGNKAIAVDSDRSPLPTDADVVPCQTRRRYHSYNGNYQDESNYYDGIRFYSTEGTEIINFPKRHRKKGETLNSRADGNYKETIRIFKNARNRLVKKGRLRKENAPSYYIECLLSNVTSQKFRTDDLQTRYVRIVEHLQDANMQGFSTQHGLEDLFGRSETKWRRRNAQTFVSELVWLWQNGD